jgi:cell division protein FtsZ
VTGGPNLTLFEVNQAAAIIRETAHPDVNMIFGAVIDPDMGDEIRVTVIATGFERTGLPRRVAQLRPATTAVPATTRVHAVPLQQQQETVSVEAQNVPAQQNGEFKPQTFNTEDLDIPTFLRNRR